MSTELRTACQLPKMADVLEIRSLAELLPYRLAWQALLAETPRPSFFKTFDWLVTAWEHFPEEYQFCVLVIRSCGKPIGFVPLCVVHEQYTIGEIRTLTYPLADWGAWYGPIGKNQAACHWLAMQHLAAAPRDWDLLDLRWLEPDVDGLASAMHAAELTPHEQVYQETSLIEISGSWDEYLATRDKKQRHEIRRKLRLEQRVGGVEFIRFRPAGAAEGDGRPGWDVLKACESIATASWQGSSQTGNTITHDHVRSFVRACHEAAARLGMLDVSLLKIDGRPAAFLYAYHYEGDVFGLRMGFHPDFAQIGAGASLSAWMLCDSFARGDQRVDLGAGDFQYKRRYRTCVEQSRQLTYYPPALRSQGVRFTRWFKSRQTRREQEQLASFAG